MVPDITLKWVISPTCDSTAVLKTNRLGASEASIFSSFPATALRGPLSSGEGAMFTINSSKRPIPISFRAQVQKTG